jgi:hypothetical protein
MSLPSVENGYQAGPGLVLTRAVWNAVFASINQRISAREALEASFEGLIAEGTALSIQAIQDNLGPQLVSIAGQISALQALILVAEDAVAELVAGNLPASSVIFTPAAGIAAGTVQGALVELAGDISSFATAMAELVSANATLTASVARIGRGNARLVFMTGY